MIRNTGSFEKDFRAASGNLIHEGMECTEEEKELIRLRYLSCLLYTSDAADD